MGNKQSFSWNFGELLEVYRKRQRLTQKHLALQLGVHMNTVSCWELGTYLPATRGLVLELARHLELNESETRQFLEASLTGLPPYWHMPFPRNPFFTGRDEILETLHANLHAEQAVALTQSYALHGLGGIGKTQIALEYAYRHALEYSAVFWIEAETDETALSSLLHVATLLQAPERQETDQQRAVAAVQRWLCSHSGWLLIWDNLEDLELLSRLLPGCRKGAILLTTRCQALGTLAQGIDLDVMGQEEGMLLLLRRAKVLAPQATREHLQQFGVSSPDEYAAAAELVAALGALPLALDQAGAYIEETGCNLAGYLQRYEQQRARLLDRRGNPSNDHSQSVTATFRLSMERVEREKGTAADLLRVCALLHAEAIPEELFLEGATHLGPTLEALANNPCQFDQALAALRGLSLVRRYPETGTLSLHRLVQVVLREGMSEQAQAMWLRRVIHALNARFPEMTAEHSTIIWRQCERLLPHVLAGAAAIPDQAGGAELAQVLWKAADYLRERARYEQVEPLYERALRVGEQALGAAHPHLAYPLTGLAYFYQEQGKFERAESLFQRALQIREQALGMEHPLVTYPLMGLAILSEKQGKSERAEYLYTRALQIRERALGPEHPLVAHPLNGLAILYRRQGDPRRAEPLYERALSIQVQALGPEHPQLARLLYNLAHLYQEQGKYEQAEPLFRRSLRIGEQAWGPEHPNIAYPLNGLAELYIEQEKNEQAELLSKRALSLWEQAWGPEHLLVAYPLSNLATLAQRQGKNEQAELLSKRSLRIAEQGLGPEHPQLAHPLNALADLYAEQGEVKQAEPLYLRALQILTNALRTEHPDLAAILNGLANLYAEQGKVEQAEPLYERALCIQDAYLGPHHPGTAQTLHDLATFHQKQGHVSRAFPFAERALSIRTQSLGNAHSKTGATRTLFAQLAQEHTYTEQRASAARGAQEQPGRWQERLAEGGSIPLQESTHASLSGSDPLQAFLDACCEMHPRAWSPSSELWQTYERWAEEHQQRFPLSRRAFAAQLKAYGFHAGRTKTARIWRGIAIARLPACKKVTQGDAR